MSVLRVIGSILFVVAVLVAAAVVAGVAGWLAFK
jgi:hypothetical protein